VTNSVKGAIVGDVYDPYNKLNISNTYFDTASTVSAVGRTNVVISGITGLTTALMTADNTLTGAMPLGSAFFKRANTYMSYYPELICTADAYEITLNGGGGDGGTDKVNAVVSAVMPPAEAPTRTGYDFGGYYASENGGGARYYTEAMASVIPWDVAADRTLYAKWTIINYGITYTLNGADNAANPVSYNVTTTPISLLPATRAGYTFNGWYTNGSFTGDAVAIITQGSVGARAFYAKLTENVYTVSYNGNGNTGGAMLDSTHTLAADQKIAANGYLRTGYTFTGWNTLANGSGTPYAVSQSIKALPGAASGALELFAQWSVHVYTVEYVNNHIDATGETANSDHVYGEGKALRVNGYSRTGYIFGGWSLAADGVKLYDNNEIVINLTAEDGVTVKLYAKWTPNTYTVTYDGNAAGVVGSMGSVVHTYDDTDSLAVSLYSKTGYTLTGWNTLANGSGTPYALEANIRNLLGAGSGVMLLYARWEANTYTVTYDGNGSTSGSMALSYYIYDGGGGS
jgi:uncharacterized repeat protein (TIGR02543 family)